METAFHLLPLLDSTAKLCGTFNLVTPYVPTFTDTAGEKLNSRLITYNLYQVLKKFRLLAVLLCPLHTPPCAVNTGFFRHLTFAPKEKKLSCLAKRPPCPVPIGALHHVFVWQYLKPHAAISSNA